MEPKPDETSLQDLGQELRQGRPFSLAEAIAREGSGFLKGESPIPVLTQAQHHLRNVVQTHLPDTEGALASVLCRWLIDDTATLSRYLNQPLLALEALLQHLLSHTELRYELIRQVNRLWGELNGERPHFQQPNQPPHPDDAYTHTSVETDLTVLLAHVRAELAHTALETTHGL
ncbi:MAG: hypothetical protein HC926_01450 [Synechococcaceae cyanobacterium SM2_3_60]|nr:hypothetical protein [Synechococcaceae cyanobacterium SM2_3_60]